MGVNLFIAEKSQGAIPSSSHADCSKKRKECSSSKKIDKVRRLTLERSEEKKENEEEPLTFTIANQEIQLPFSYKERLARDSDFFKGLFAHPMQERVTGKYKIEDINLEEFQKLITLWSGDSTVSAQEACDLLEVGSRLGLGEPLVEILIPTIKNWSPTDMEDIETACALSLAPFLDSLPSLKSELEIFLVKAYLATSNHKVQKNLLEGIQILDIRDLNLSESSVDDRDLEILINVVLINCPNLATLSLQRTLITDQSAVLKRLDISKNAHLTDEGKREFMVRGNLREFNITWCDNLTGATIKHIIQLPRLMCIQMGISGAIVETAKKK